jgi:hypothetical protein
MRCDADHTLAAIATAMKTATTTANGAAADCRALRTTPIFRLSSRVGPAGLGTIPFCIIYAMGPPVGSNAEQIGGWICNLTDDRLGKA